MQASLCVLSLKSVHTKKYTGGINQHCSNWMIFVDKCLDNSDILAEEKKRVNAKNVSESNRNSSHAFPSYWTVIRVTTGQWRVMRGVRNGPDVSEMGDIDRWNVLRISILFSMVIIYDKTDLW